MSELWRFFDQNSWNELHDYLVQKEFSKHANYFDEIERISPFEDDINRVLTSLITFKFNGKIENVKNWLDKQVPALDNKTPREISLYENGMDWIREFILRTH